MKNFEFLYTTRTKVNYNANSIEEACEIFLKENIGEDIELDYEVETDDGEMIDISHTTCYKNFLS